MTLKTIFVFIFLINCNISKSTTTKQNEFKKASYYSRWSLRNGLTPDKVNGTLFTHLIFAFAVIQNDSVALGDQQDPGRFQELINLKAKFPHLKVMISLACGIGDRTLSDIVTNPERRTTLVNSSVPFLKKYGFDGLDIDWEFPAWDGAPHSDKDNFILLLKELREVFNKEEKDSLLLSAAVSAGWTIIIPAYNVPEMSKYVDFINLMSYDFHSYSRTDPLTGFNSPLFKRRDEILFLGYLNTAWAANFWMRLGMKKSQIVVGLPTYGQGYILKTPEKHGVMAPAVSGNGTYSYHEICPFLAEGATRVFDKESQVPYLYKNEQWISYDDEESFSAKCHWVRDQEIEGVFTWSLEQDDWTKVCGQKMFPLHTVIYEILS